jgi:hypothetical protein
MTPARSFAAPRSFSSSLQTSHQLRPAWTAIDHWEMSLRPLKDPEEITLHERDVVIGAVLTISTARPAGARARDRPLLPARRARRRPLGAEQVTPLLQPSPARR